MRQVAERHGVSINIDAARGEEVLELPRHQMVSIICRGRSAVALPPLPQPPPSLRISKPELSLASALSRRFASMYCRRVNDDAPPAGEHRFITLGDGP